MRFQRWRAGEARGAQILHGLGVWGEGKDVARVGSVGNDGSRGGRRETMCSGEGDDRGGCWYWEVPLGVDIELAQARTGGAGVGDVRHEVRRDGIE